MSIRVDVCNFALGALGESEINSIEDDSDKARTLKSFYYIARDAVLEEGEWTFATRRFLPAKSTTVPEWGWAFVFVIPTDIIRLAEVDRNMSSLTSLRDTSLPPNPIPHTVEFVNGVGEAILCNEDPIFCKGVRRIEDEGIYSPLFVEAFSLKLAYLAALPITSSVQIQQTVMGLYGHAIRTAKPRNGMQGTTRRMRSRSLSRARG